MTAKLASLVLALLSMAAAAETPPLALEEASYVSLGPAEAAPGTVVLEIADRLPEDPEDSVRLRAVFHGPVSGEGATDIYALNAVLLFPADHLAFVPGSLRKGELLGRDGKDTLITGGTLDGKETRLTVGATRLGAIPGVSAPRGRAEVFSVAVRVLKPGDVEIAWEDATFIDSGVRAIGTAHFVGGTLSVSAPPDKTGKKEKNEG